MFLKTNKLKNLNLSEMLITKEKAETLNFALFPSSLQEIDYSHNPIFESSKINKLFSCTPNLKKVTL